MKKLNFSKSNVRSKLKKFRVFLEKHSLIHLKAFPLLFYFIITALLNTLLLRVLTVGNFYYFKPLFFDLGMLFIFASFSFLFKTDKKRKKSHFYQKK